MNSLCAEVRAAHVEAAANPPAAIAPTALEPAAFFASRAHLRFRLLAGGTAPTASRVAERSTVPNSPRVTSDRSGT